MRRAPKRLILDRNSRQARGLIAFWPLVEDFGSLGKNQITNNAQTLTSVTTRATFAGRKAYFNGTSAYGISSNVSTPSAYSVVAWVIPTAIGAQLRILDSDAYNLGGFFLGTGISSNWQFLVNSGSATDCAGGRQIVGKPTFLVGTYNGTTGILYENGAQIASQAFTNPGAKSLPIYVGRYAVAASNYFPGNIYDVRIYSRALSPDDVREMYENPDGIWVSRRQFAFIPSPRRSLILNQFDYQNILVR